MFRFALMPLIITVTAQVGLAQEMPAEIRDQISQHYIGSWSFSMKSEGGVVNGTCNAKWAPGKHCVIVTQVANTPEGKVRESGLLAWQPDAKSIVHHGYMSSGDYFQITYNKFEGNTWSGRVTGLVDGKRPADSDASVVWKTDSFSYKDNIFEYEATRTKGGKKK